MNEEISVNVTNTTSLIQPVTLFTEVFGIPQNLRRGNDTYSWDLSSESYNFGLAPAVAKIQFSTSPVTSSTPYTTSSYLPTNDISGVVSALNGLGIGTFTSAGNILSVTSSSLYYGNVQLSPTLFINATTSPLASYNALEVIVNGVTIAAVQSGNGLIGFYWDAQVGDSITVNYRSTNSWNLNMFYNVFLLPVIFTDSGLGATNSSYTFTAGALVNSGYIQIDYTAT